MEDDKSNFTRWTEMITLHIGIIEELYTYVHYGSMPKNLSADEQALFASVGATLFKYQSGEDDCSKMVKTIIITEASQALCKCRMRGML